MPGASLESALRASQNFAARIHRTPDHSTVPSERGIESRMARIQTLKGKIAAIQYRSELGLSDIDRAVQLAEERGFTLALLSQAAATIRGNRRDYHTLTIYDEVVDLKHARIRGRELKHIVPEVVDPSLVAPGLDNGAAYHPDKPLIAYTSAESTPLETLQSLAYHGLLTPRTRLANHEWIHATQYILGSGRAIPPELQEAQAYRAEPVSNNPGDQTMNHIVTSRAYDRLDPRKLASAYFSIDRLNAFGYSQRKITKILGSTGEWDDQRGFWTGIHGAIEAQMRQSGLSEEGLEQMVTEQQLVRTLAMHTARLHTQRILKNAFPDVFGVQAGTLYEGATHASESIHPQSRRPTTYIRPER